MPADVVGGPGKVEEACRDGVGDRNGRRADNSQRSVGRKSVGVPSEAGAWCGGSDGCKSAAVTVRAKKLECVRSGDSACCVGQREAASEGDNRQTANEVIRAGGGVQFHD